MVDKVKKVRADVLLHQLGLCEDTETAKKLIMAGKARVREDHVIKKPSELFPSDTQLTIIESSPYVSRGAYKLLPALEKYIPDMNCKVGFDVGASTGGFTDLMLQKGASKVYTVDVGRAQLHLKLRQDPRVIVHEKVNARNLESNFLPEKVDVLTMDVSFISVLKVLPPTLQFLKDGGIAFILLKPQFEAKKHEVEKGGVVRDKTVSQRCIDDVIDFVEQLEIGELKFEHVEVIASPIKGPKGNQEFIIVFKAQ
jgi:23S rRNA (cytidine1920-2'-O)/16S rRNA (cytidine1409-2'-O)-methyltransferase